MRSNPLWPFSSAWWVAASSVIPRCSAIRGSTRFARARGLRACWRRRRRSIAKRRQRSRRWTGEEFWVWGIDLMRFPIYVSFCALLVSSALQAQQDMGVITGVVTDASGAVVSGARVMVTNTETNESRAVETQVTGAYTIGPLRLGTYAVAVEKTGFKKEVWPGIILHAQDRARADFKLALGQVAETIAVTTEAPLIQAETATLSNVVNQREVRGLPLNGRNFQQLAWLSAGVTAATQSRDKTSGFNSNGQQTTQNNFIMDGVDNNNNVMGMQDRKAQVIIPSLDAVSEFKVQTSNYSAEFGRNTGAVMIVSIKSGSNGLHGTAYEYLRNDKFDS